MWCCRVAGEDTKTGPYMANMIAQVIDEIEDVIGSDKVIAFTTDNASDDNRRCLKIPIATCWYSHYECMEFVMESERTIRDMSMDDLLQEKYATKKGNAFKKIALSETFKLHQLGTGAYSLHVDHTRSTDLFTAKQLDDSVDELKILALLGLSIGQTRYYADSPITWCLCINVMGYSLLATIAQRIFTVPTSSVAAERSWSIFKYMHISQRNRLSNNPLIMLVFIYSNHGSKTSFSDVVIVTVACSGLGTWIASSSPCSGYVSKSIFRLAVAGLPLPTIDRLTRAGGE
ncbi:hypothetical protein PHMEG_00016016 [Phytophthora megakarya]|uniref:HAT C-terminal dimerisation domain-containing protein n=1 Tax=Phytophthora megakarya TaxID=4795 RepID=A0A225W1X2_9STRA|nr:hypothetical protein PHMEG_00016016 [Phytophthora megakarya]